MIMLRYSIGATVVALAAWIGLTTPAQAQHGGHGSGGHASGGHASGGHASGGHVSGGHVGGVHAGGVHSGGVYHGGYYHNGNYYHHSYGYGYPYLSLGIYSYPSYGYGGYYSPSTAYYNGNYYIPSDSTQSNYYTPTPTPTTEAADNRARIVVRIPADAALWVDGDPTQQTGSQREFVTPPLAPGDTFTYTLKGRWMQGDQPVEKTIKVDVRANQTSVADFMR
jgi:uncharacterized protein (TIGR03000 family)